MSRQELFKLSHKGYAQFSRGIDELIDDLIAEIEKDLQKRQFEEPYTAGINYCLGRLTTLTK